MIEFNNNIITDPNADNHSNWYVIYTKARLEAVARDQLQRQNFDAYLPLMETLKRKKGQLISVITPFFPRYLFVRFNRASDDWAPIRSTRGVCGLVRFEGVPKPVPDQLIDALKQNEDTEQLQAVTRPTWQLGDEVAIEQGPFAGYRCIFQARRSADRVAVLLNIVGKPTRATLSYQDLQIPQFA